MKNPEFSDAFDTLLNSYSTQAQFGEQASREDITLNEYEKSVLLTQAQDLVVKSYFDRTLNSQGQGFDDSTRRQVDFSSLIKVEDLQAEVSPTTGRFDERGMLFKLPRYTDKTGTSSAKVLFILNEKLIVTTTTTGGYWWRASEIRQGAYTDEKAASLGPNIENIADAEAIGWQYVQPTIASRKEYVIVPISYKEYDREMSKAFAQPLKKQAWRLFQNKTTGFDLDTELIVKESIRRSAAIFTYRIRYIRRPQPIILETLPNGLTIDGESTESQCELNPILHMDILNKAVELAIATRGYNSKHVVEASERE